MIIKGRSPKGETRVQNPQSCAWSVDWQNRLGTKDPNKCVDTKWHANQSEFHAGRVEPSFSICSTSWISRCPLAAISAIFFLNRSESRVPCQREVKKRLPVNLHRWRNQNQWFQRRRGPSTWCYAAHGARVKILRRIWDIRSIRSLSMKDEVIILAQGDQYGPTQNLDVERSQVRRQENVHNSDSWKQGDQEESSNCTGTRRFVRAGTPTTEFQNMKYTNHPYMTKVFRLLQKNEIFCRILFIFMGSNKGKCVDMENVHVFVNESSHSSWTKLFGEPGGLQEHELRGNSELISISHRNWFWSILKIFRMWKRLKVHLPHGWDQYCLMTKWSSGQKQKHVSAQIFRCVLGQDEWKQRCNFQIGRSSGRMQYVPVVNRWRSNWIRVESFPRIFVVADSSRDPAWFAKTEHQTWEIHRPDHLHVNVQRHRLDKEGKWWNLYFEFRKVKEYANSRRDTGRVSVLETTATQMVQRFKDTGHPVPRRIRGLSCGILKRKNGRDTIHFNADALNTMILFRIIRSVSQLSIYGAVSNRCEQFGLTEKETGQDKQKESVTRGVLTSVKSQEVKLLVSSPRQVSGNSMWRKHSGLRLTVRDISIHKGLRTRIVPAQGISWYELQNSTWRGRRFWADHSFH